MAAQRTLLAVVVLLTSVACAPGEPSSPSTNTPATGDGSIPKNESISLDADNHAAIANLDPALLSAMRTAAADAKLAGVELRVTSGWRSREHQQRLLDEAIDLYRSEAEARRWVHPPEKSAHVTGKAIDIGPTNADDWLIQHGSDYGLCQAYANEMWHFELLTTPGGECPQPQSNAVE